MIRKRGRIATQLLVFASMFGTIGELLRESLRSRSGRRWMIPLLVFLCVNALLLILVGSVEALAPFVYAIF